MWLGRALGFLSDEGFPSEHLVDFVFAVAADGDVPEGCIGRAVDKWRQEVLCRESLQGDNRQVDPVTVFNTLTHVIRGFYEGAEQFNSTWYERSAATVLGDQYYRHSS